MLADLDDTPDALTEVPFHLGGLLGFEGIERVGSE
jgi:hypothetical protein